MILGSTGSIGRQALDVVRRHAARLEIVALATGGDEAGLAEQAAEFGVKRTGLGAEAAATLAGIEEADVVVNGIVGAAGLPASVAALEAGKILALANKESLVAGGDVCLAAATRGGGRIVPVDSEHAAIAQCLEGSSPESVARICLTASGGPFRERSNLSNVTVEEALAHPTWEMGPKITVDCATLMNKGLEVIEAHFLFGVDFDRIDILVHPGSIVHGMVTFADGSVVMQAAVADMRLPLQAAMLGPERVGSTIAPVDFASAGSLKFQPVDHARFPAVGLAYQAGKDGGTSPAVLNAANEEAVRGFLEDRVRFVDIPNVVEETLSAHNPVDAGNLETVLEVDAWARDHARGVIETRPRGIRRVVDKVLGRTP